MWFNNSIFYIESLAWCHMSRMCEWWFFLTSSETFRKCMKQSFLLKQIKFQVVWMRWIDMFLKSVYSDDNHDESTLETTFMNHQM